MAGYSINGTNDDFAVVRYNNTITGITTIANQTTELSIYPNPATEILNISLPENLKTELQIFNAMGMLVKEISITQSTQINISDVASGLYFVHLKNNQQHAQKFIKQ